MAKQFVVILFSILALLCAGTVMAQDETPAQSESPAQDETEDDFNLIVGEEEAEKIEEDVAEEPEYVPAIEPGKFDLTLTLGYFNMTKTLLEHQRIIYKATDEAFFYGDVKLVNEAAFNPILRLGYTFTDWFALELQGGVTFSKYKAEITNPMQVDPAGGNPSPVPEVGEFDAENRSALIFIGNLNGLIYPLNIAGDGEGRWHPYITGGPGVAMYNIDSNYVDDPASGFNVNLGIGLKVIADDLISVRAEILYHWHQIQFEPAEYFDSRDADTKRVPVYEFDEAGRYAPVRAYKPQDLGGLAWQLGFAIAL